MAAAIRKATRSGAGAASRKPATKGTATRTRTGTSRKGAGGRRALSLTERLVQVIEARGMAVSIAEATRAVRGDTKVVSATLSRLRSDGRIRRVGRGLYAPKRGR